MTRTTETTADVLIVGGGITGLTLAAALGGAGLEVVCVDRDSPEIRLDEAFDGRTTAIAYGSQQIMAGAGVWRHLAPHGEPILDIRVADGRSPLFLHYDHREVGERPSGWIIENRLIRHGLFTRLGELASVKHLAPAAVARFERAGRRVVAELADGRRIAAPLLVGADGRNSMTRQWAGITTTGWAYWQQAIVCTVEHELPHAGVAVEHFLPAGPFAILPMQDDANGAHRSSVVWTELKETAPAMLALPQEAFDAELQRRFGGQLGPVRQIGRRFGYPLHLMHANAYTADRIALIGEAAHVIHPIAGQGLNLGFRDVATLAEVVVDAARLGLDVGGADVLARYQRWRRPDNVALAAVTDGLNRLFSNSIAPVRIARDLGIAAVNRIPPLKGFFMRHAMGTVGALPRMARGEAL